jgi:hypothetical protein
MAGRRAWRERLTPRYAHASLFCHRLVPRQVSVSHRVTACVPFAEALSRLAAALPPRGTLLVVGCYQEGTLLDRAVSLAALPANMVVGYWKNHERRPAPPSMSARTARPTMTLKAVRETAGRVLPGARTRRGLFWRYLLRYSAPA